MISSNSSQTLSENASLNHSLNPGKNPVQFSVQLDVGGQTLSVLSDRDLSVGAFARFQLSSVTTTLSSQLRPGPLGLPLVTSESSQSFANSQVTKTSPAWKAQWIPSSSAPLPDSQTIWPWKGVALPQTAEWELTQDFLQQRLQTFPRALAEEFSQALATTGWMRGATPVLPKPESLDMLLRLVLAQPPGQNPNPEEIQAWSRAIAPETRGEAGNKASVQTELLSGFRPVGLPQILQSLTWLRPTGLPLDPKLLMGSPSHLGLGTGANAGATASNHAEEEAAQNTAKEGAPSQAGSREGANLQPEGALRWPEWLSRFRNQSQEHAWPASLESWAHQFKPSSQEKGLAHAFAGLWMRDENWNEGETRSLFYHDGQQWRVAEARYNKGHSRKRGGKGSSEGPLKAEVATETPALGRVQIQIWMEKESLRLDVKNDGVDCGEGVEQAMTELNRDLAAFGRHLESWTYGRLPPKSEGSPPFGDADENPVPRKPSGGLDLIG
jgi:hypothetical protein